MRVKNKKEKRRWENYYDMFFVADAYGSMVPKFLLRMSTPFCCMCNVTSVYVIDRVSTVQLGLGQSAASSNCCWVGGFRVAEAVICPLRGVMFVVGPVVGPKVAVFGGGLLPPGLTHCNCTVT